MGARTAERRKPRSGASQQRIRIKDPVAKDDTLPAIPERGWI